MLYHIASALKSQYAILNVVHYISFRAIACLLTSLILSFIFGSKFIEISQKFFSVKVRQYTPSTHQIKNGTPTMGGLFIILISISTIFLWSNLWLPEVWIVLLALIAFGALGFVDDWNKIFNKKGISERFKFISQLVIAAILVLLWLYFLNPSTNICLPFFKNINPDLGIFIVLWAIFIIVGSSNAVNLTDGLDGLAIGSLILNFAVFSIISYLAGHFTFATYLQIPFTGTSELAIIGATLVGSSLGFLWYNAYPAQIFMGDVGSLPLGAVLALIALMSKQELLLAISGGLFVVETLSVILQIFSVKFFKKRMFKMAPIHHHFELVGWQEAKITIRCGIITFVLCLIALITLKLR